MQWLLGRWVDCRSTRLAAHIGILPLRRCRTAPRPRYATAPNNAPAAAVMPMAAAPHTVTLQAPSATRAPPARAASAPRAARKTSDAHDHPHHQLRRRRHRHNDQGQGRTRRKAARRRPGRLSGSGAESLRNAEFVPRMCTQRIVEHELCGHLARQFRFESALDIDACQFALLGHRVGLQFEAFARQIGCFGVGLRMHRHVFAGRHRHRTCHQAGHSRHQDGAVAGTGSCHPEYEAGGRHDAVVGPQHGSPQPADAVSTVPFPVKRVMWPVVPLLIKRRQPQSRP